MSYLRLLLAFLLCLWPPVADARSDAEYARHATALRQRLGAGYTVLVEKPFVVIGDESRAAVERRARVVVRWATEQLKRAYFPKDPAQVIDIWLLRDAESYGRHVRQMFGSAPHTPYGFYSSAKRALVMNIATGGGTLVHEMVHPFMEANFPRCPSWLNEGLGSLYEQSSERGGEIVGLTNWRLAGLQAAIRRRGLPSFQELMETSTRQFYDQDPGTNYAQSRYLLYYLQERGLLRAFYREVVKHQASDPSGHRALQRLLKARNMAAFQRGWEQWVLKLRFPQL